MQLTRKRIDYINAAPMMSGVYLGPTRSISSPKDTSRMGCLCLDKDIYTIKCCKGALQSQGIGNISANKL